MLQDIIDEHRAQVENLDDNEDAFHGAFADGVECALDHVKRLLDGTELAFDLAVLTTGAYEADNLGKTLLNRVRAGL